MCRWFTYLGNEEQLLEDILIRPKHSLIKQIDSHYLPAEHQTFDPSSSTTSLPPSAANDDGSPNPLTNMDGFGLGWWSDSFSQFEDGISGRQGDRPVVYKNTRPPLNDLVLKSLAAGVKTRAVVAHVRAGTGLTPVVETNCHPFTFGRHLFCHNGVVGSFHLYRPTLLTFLPLRYQLAILGTTDSEHVAALYFYYLCGEEGDWNTIYPVEKMGEAMRKTVKKVEEMKASSEESEIEHNALNFLVSSGASLVAIRYASPVGREPPSLYYSTTAGATLNRKFKGHPDEPLADEGGKEKVEHGKHVIVASEPNTFEASEWELIRPGEMVLVNEGMELRTEKLGIEV